MLPCKRNEKMDLSGSSGKIHFIYVEFDAAYQAYCL